MIRLSKMADYGIVILAHVADGAPGTVHTARSLAAASGLSLPMVSKVTKALAKAGLLASQRGVRGGYLLVHQAAKVSVLDVIDALEGPVALTQCGQHGQGTCDIEQACPVKRSWHQINHTITQALAGLSVADMRAPHTPIYATGGKR